MPFSVKSFSSCNNELTNEEKVICYQLTITLNISLEPLGFLSKFCLEALEEMGLRLLGDTVLMLCLCVCMGLRTLTYVYVCVYRGHVECVKVLLQLNAPLRPRTPEEDTPKELANRYKQKEVVELLGE